MLLPVDLTKETYFFPTSVLLSLAISFDIAPFFSTVVSAGECVAYGVILRGGTAGGVDGGVSGIYLTGNPVSR